MNQRAAAEDQHHLGRDSRGAAGAGVTQIIEAVTRTLELAEPEVGGGSGG